MEDYLEKFEVVMITNQVLEDASVMQLLKVFLKGEARTWFLQFKAQAVGRRMTFDGPRRNVGKFW